MRAQLFTNQWFGKAVGFTAAFVLAPDHPVLLSVLVIAGIGCGHMFDLWSARESAHQKVNPRRRATSSTAELAPAQSQYLFTALGRVAKQSGRVTKRHVKLTEQLITQLQLNSASRRQAIYWFNQGKDAQHSIDSLALECRKFEHNQARLRSLVTTYMCRMAAIEPSDHALTATVRLAGLLNVDPGLVAKEFGEALHPVNQGQSNTDKPKPTHSGTRDPAPAPKTPLDLAYAELKVAPNATARQVKTAYRRLISKHHPDKLGPRASAQAQDKAKQRMVALQQALERIEAAQK